MSSVSQCMIVSRAKAKRLATKQTQLLSAPRHLLLGLVFFSQTMHGRRLTATKNMALVSIEQEITLNVGKCMHQYDLYAVLVHEGQSLHKAITTHMRVTPVVLAQCRFQSGTVTTMIRWSLSLRII